MPPRFAPNLAPRDVPYHARPPSECTRQAHPRRARGAIPFLGISSTVTALCQVYLVSIYQRDKHAQQDMVSAEFFKGRGGQHVEDQISELSRIWTAHTYGRKRHKAD